MKHPRKRLSLILKYSKIGTKASDSESRWASLHQVPNRFDEQRPLVLTLIGFVPIQVHSQFHPLPQTSECQAVLLHALAPPHNLDLHELGVAHHQMNGFRIKPVLVYALWQLFLSQSRGGSAVKPLQTCRLIASSRSYQKHLHRYVYVCQSTYAQK
ncbi:MAG: hypothetical protein CM15mP59_0570 [Flavobacteriaceae bacterium]|nr:MAG: hypothetical protein CM15mP59_0570 [Flavobacteriaceae bacterium]